MKDEVEQEAFYMNLTAEHLREYAAAVEGKGAVPFSSKRLRERGRELLTELEKTRKDITDIAERHEYENGETEEGERIKAVSLDVAGEVGSLAATFDLATGELPGYNNAERGSEDVAQDFKRTAEYLEKLAERLSKIPVK